MSYEWWYRVALVTLGILLAVLVRTSDISPIPAVAVLAVAAWDIFRGLRGRKP
jgi:hypothetical protein